MAKAKDEELKPFPLGASPDPVKDPTPPPNEAGPAKKKYRVSIEGVPRSLEIEADHPAIAKELFNKELGIIRSDYPHVVEEV